MRQLRENMAFCSIKILFGQVGELHTCLDECEDDDEKRALEEDITGNVRSFISYDGESDDIYNIDHSCMLPWSLP